LFVVRRTFLLSPVTLSFFALALLMTAIPLARSQGQGAVAAREPCSSRNRSEIRFDVCRCFAGLCLSMDLLHSDDCFVRAFPTLRDWPVLARSSTFWVNVHVWNLLLLFAVLFCMRPLCSTTESATKVLPAGDALTLWYDRPASSALSEALPVGDAGIAALVSGWLGVSPELKARASKVSA
jgi:hypothetical protein